MNQSEVVAYLAEKIRAGELTARQANVDKVRMLRVQLVTTRMPADVRSALNEAVKARQLGHLKKDGYKPEAYFHPNFDYLARGTRADHERQTINTLKACASVFA